MWIPHKLGWVIEFFDLAVREDHYFIGVHNGIESMCYNKHGWIFELRVNKLLYFFLSDYVYTSCGLIHDNNLWLSQNSSTYADQLLFTRTKVLPVLLDLLIKTIFAGIKEVLKLCSHEKVNNIFVLVLVLRIKVEF